ncbi:MAG TPA: class I SAM-dependent methyltransferase [archaeon]|nr:class I SAM-dependent methyltransferase [archaeon]
MDYNEAINNQYGQINLGSKILAALQGEGKDWIKDIQESLRRIEELHSRGRKATVELAHKAGLGKNMRVLDVGSGIGGPARTLAFEFGTHVTGLDLCQEYCQAAKSINQRLDLSDKIEIHQGNALEMPFDDNSFDFVMIQHVLMNIENKERLFSQVHRVLRPKGLMAIYTICAGDVTEIYFPVVWANDSSINFLLTPQELLQLIKDSGFKVLSWKDDTSKIIEGFQRRKPKKPSNTPRYVNFELVIPNIAEKSRNIIRNFKEGRIVVFQGIFELNS